MYYYSLEELFNSIVKSAKENNEIFDLTIEIGSISTVSFNGYKYKVHSKCNNNKNICILQKDLEMMYCGSDKNSGCLAGYGVILNSICSTLTVCVNDGKMKYMIQYEEHISLNGLQTINDDIPDFNIRCIPYSYIPKTAQQGDAPEPANNAVSASQPSIPPAR